LNDRYRQPNERRILTLGPDEKPGDPTVDRVRGAVSFWSPTDPVNGAMGIALRVDPATIVGVTADFENYLVLVRQTPGRPFVHYIGATWSKGPDFPTRETWETYVMEAPVSFRP